MQILSVLTQAGMGVRLSEGRKRTPVPHPPWQFLNSLSPR
jgi:hypothetical protein